MIVTIFGEDWTKNVVCGSHLDSVKNGGMYDGVLGVQLADDVLGEVIKKVEGGNLPEKNYVMTSFRAEESSPKTGIACLGSLIATGQITQEKLEELMYETDKGQKPFKDFFIDKYGRDQWEAVLDEIENPRFTAENTDLFFELHIEQSGVIETQDKDLGIVVDGVGGSRREEVKIEDDISNTEKLEGDFVEFSLDFIGEMAHTGGAPSNEKFENDGVCNYYRKDALIGGAKALQLLFDKFTELKLTAFDQAEDTGFTTVPPLQQLSFIIPASREGEVRDYLKELTCYLDEKLGVGLEAKSKEFEQRNVTYFDKEKIKEHLEIPLQLESLVRNANNDFGGVGKLRVTVTDFHIVAKGDKERKQGIEYRVDYRDVDTEAVANMVGDVHGKIEKTLERLRRKLGDVLLVRGDKPYAPFVDQQKIAVLRDMARGVGLDFVEMPSMPGHDMASFNMANVPGAMLFVRHDGVSHNPKEDIEEHDYEKARVLAMAFLLQELGYWD